MLSSFLKNFWQFLFVLVEKCWKFFDKQGYAGLELIHLSKNFDCIFYKLRPVKLHDCDFSLESLKLIRNYLSNLIQRAKVTSSFSDFDNVLNVEEREPALSKLNEDVFQQRNL